MSPVPPEAVVMVVLGVAFFVGYLLLMRHAGRLEHADRVTRAAEAEARRLAQRRAFDDHVTSAPGVFDWVSREREVSS